MPPAPVGNWSRTLPTVIDLILRALAPAIPQRIAAGHKGDMGGYAFFGSDPRTGRRFLCQTIMGGGWGGRAHEDGESATVSICQGGVQNAPVELQELYYPVIDRAAPSARGKRRRGKISWRVGYRDHRANALRCLRKYQCRAHVDTPVGSVWRPLRGAGKSAGQTRRRMIRVRGSLSGPTIR